MTELVEWKPDWSVHPGETLRETLQERGLTQLACATLIGRTPQVVNQIINGKKSITADTALDLEHGLGISAEFWVRLQADYDLSVARQRRARTST
ncbi:HigA family addiction module antitoxin [Lentzea sp. NBRC 105346]|uniref:HigA family addiction module antitoxin n=1 Tax=Lentzea sp. NBRC 105346 TaxID=3032205 RepID=UPI0025528D07|nr:HigA family addiction module antitoxin [Lentzea sp. NBRC 105346]